MCIRIPHGSLLQTDSDSVSLGQGPENLNLQQAPRWCWSLDQAWSNKSLQYVRSFSSFIIVIPTSNTMCGPECFVKHELNWKILITFTHVINWVWLRSPPYQHRHTHTHTHTHHTHTHTYQGSLHLPWYIVLQSSTRTQHAFSSLSHCLYETDFNPSGSFLLHKWCVSWKKEKKTRGEISKKKETTV